MSDIALIDIRKNILEDNDRAAEWVRDLQDRTRTCFINVMASPGAGKTSLIMATLDRMDHPERVGVVEGDIDSFVDSEKFRERGIQTVQIRTGGACHLDAPMVKPALDELDLDGLDLVFIENVGNLVCPAEFDMGTDARVMLLSVPEGDDKVLKYPLMFTVSDALVVTKTDYLDGPGSDFDLERLRQRATTLNPGLRIFPVSARTGEGMHAWVEWLEARRAERTGA
jgi:hydrogenase nickel incorporation protein HypB